MLSVLDCVICEVFGFDEPLLRILALGFAASSAAAASLNVGHSCLMTPAVDINGQRDCKTNVLLSSSCQLTVKRYACLAL